jgi:hypothetical protein
MGIKDGLQTRGARAQVLRQGKHVGLVFECASLYEAMLLYDKVVFAMKGPGICFVGFPLTHASETDSDG